ncbi:hypothetical protein L0F63_005890 [Massospora cicadina]|nr:hypothetical protein L0F63_005890 [Massospora cicadina]
MLRTKSIKRLPKKQLKALFPFVEDFELDELSTVNPFDCLLTDSRRSVFGHAILGPTRLLFFGKRFSFKRLKITNLECYDHGFFYSNNIILHLVGNRLVTLSFAKHRDFPLLRPQLVLTTPCPRAGSLPILRSQSSTQPGPSKTQTVDERRAIAFESLTPAEKRISFFRRPSIQSSSEEPPLSTAEVEKRSSPLKRRYSPSSLPGEQERGQQRSFLLTRRPSSQASPEIFQSDAGAVKSVLLFDATLPIASHQLVELLFPNTQPSPLKRSLTTLTRGSPKRSLTIKNLVPRSHSEVCVSPLYTFNLKVVGPDSFIDFSCEEERTISQGVISRIETHTTLLSHTSRRLARSPICSVAYARAIIKARIPRHLLTPNSTLSPCPVVFSEHVPPSQSQESESVGVTSTKNLLPTTLLILAAVSIMMTILYLQDAALSDIEAKFNLPPTQR